MQIAITVEPIITASEEESNYGSSNLENKTSLKAPRHTRARAASSPGLIVGDERDETYAGQIADTALRKQHKGTPFIILRRSLPLAHSRTNNDLKRYDSLRNKLSS